MHEIERNVERLQVGVVAIVDERTTIAAFLYLKAHGNRLKALHTLVESIGFHPQMECHDGTGDGILDGSIVDERNREPVFIASEERIGDGGHRSLFLDGLYVHRCLAVLLRPSQMRGLQVGKR